jgi:two-component system, OmpR family, KDP operon response regulator KdpE
MRILVVEDDPDLGRQLSEGLGQAGYAVDLARDGEEGHFLGDTEPYDAVVLDLGLPKLDGVRVLEKWRTAGKDMPVLILTARDRWSEKVAGFDAGADDYVTKPFSTGELLARLRALLRSRGERSTEPAAIRIGGLEIDLASRTVSVDGLAVKLTRKEFDVVALLARNAGKLVGHKQLLTTIWGAAHAADTHYLRIAVGHIREKIGDDAADPRFIVTEPGVGYRLVDTRSPVG